MAEVAEGSRLVVGIDFGTTFSGVAFQVQTDGRGVGQVRVVLNWPCPVGHARDADEAKVPSKLSYPKDYDSDDYLSYDDDESDENSILWGYQVVEDTETTIEWPKLLLLDNTDLPDHLRHSSKLRIARQRMEAMGKTPVDLVADYLEKLWIHAMGHDEKPGFIAGCLPFDPRKFPIHVVITVPAIWKQNAQNLTEEALKRAILGTSSISFEVTTEPQAAIMAHAEEIRGLMKINDIVLCLDLGGGTADCISYRLTDSKTLDLVEVVPGDGALCGAIFLDAAFKKLLETTLSPSDRPTSAAGWKQLFYTEWEHSIKRDFVYRGSGHARKISLSNIAERSVSIHDDQLREAFNTVTVEILDLVQRQIEEIKRVTNNETPKVILLVGGFGRCPFVREALREKYGPKTKVLNKERKRARVLAGESGIQIVSDSGDMPWSAICRGAVEGTIEANVKVKSRKARVSIGFMQSLHSSQEEGGIWDSLFGCHMIPNHMTWVLRRGEDVKTCNKVLQQVLAFPDEQRKDVSYESTFYSHPSATPPSRFSRRENDFRQYGTMLITIPGPLNKLPLREDDTGETTRQLDYDLHLNPNGAAVNIQAVSTKTKKKVGEFIMGDVV